MRPTSVARWGSQGDAAERSKSPCELRSGRKRQGERAKARRSPFSGHRKVVFQGKALEK